MPCSHCSSPPAAMSATVAARDHCRTLKYWDTCDQAMQKTVKRASSMRMEVERVWMMFPTTAGIGPTDRPDARATTTPVRRDSRAGRLPHVSNRLSTLILLCHLDSRRQALSTPELFQKAFMRSEAVSRQTLENFMDECTLNQPLTGADD